MTHNRLTMLSSFGLRLTPHRTLQVVQGLRGVAAFSQLAVLVLAVHLFDISLSVSKLLWGTGLLFFA